MILQGNYTDGTKELIQSYDEQMNEKNVELESAQAETTTNLTSGLLKYTFFKSFLNKVVST